ncbi:MAG: class I SAM-dependent methyltransferase, partial [Actinobacteria bacterium]|nr:class I SAM-dependent methyltransferase [Actinomycetota bacterium]
MPAASGEELPSFEEIYARAGDDLESVPWARLAPHPLLVMWLNARPAPAAQPPALVVACGLGDDAEELAHRGYEVTAFDVSATAIAQCRRRFPASRVRYQVADVLALPEAMTRRYSLVVEINTLQSLPRPDRPRAVAAIAGAVAPGG